MELTAKTLPEDTFGANRRGYDPAEVDEFIAAVAEGVEELQERLRRATERAARAEQQLATANAGAMQADSGPSAGEISKVWERAAQAADSAVEEARHEAQRLLDDARQRAEAQLADARAEAESAVGSARDEAARMFNDSQAQLRAEISQLERAREDLKRDVDSLSGYLDTELGHVRSA